MGSRGPQRKRGSVRWQREKRASQKIAASGESSSPGPTAPDALPPDTPPICPAWLSKPTAERWGHLVADMAGAGVALKQLDSRSVAVAAGYENDLADLEALCGDPKMDVGDRIAAIRLKNSTRKDYLASLVAIGGTLVARLRARITVDEKPKATDDPWRDV